VFSNGISLRVTTSLASRNVGIGRLQMAAAATEVMVLSGGIVVVQKLRGIGSRVPPALWI
jgi:hypothetical protein